MIEEIIDYLKELSFVILPIILPIIIGLIGTKKIIHSWQIQKEKQEIRKRVLDEFDITYPKLRSHFHFIFNKIRFQYTDKTKLPDGKNTYQDAIIFPSEITEQPLQKFGDIITSTEKERQQFTINFNKFLSSLILYFESIADFNQDLDVIADLQNQQDIEITKLIQSKTKDEFIKSCINFQDIDEKLNQKFNFLRVMIVYEKIYNPEKGLSNSFYKVTKGFEIKQK